MALMWIVIFVIFVVFPAAIAGLNYLVVRFAVVGKIGRTSRVNEPVVFWIIWGIVWVASCLPFWFLVALAMATAQKL